ncbi:alpha/beta hydrolase [Leptolyngbyaceae cyanobacterium CCMR0082]|uniref:Alpha/beta hydrolase n=1 Tax=Adonisia turfae CCMR0082 TaxID=2304604 RepID=A0A6M0SA65_9CYAN|nr:alpha/beta hydrolase [Adonisia turfae]MDV3348261.1 alpha/beta hydrolase [Leptothoe sp. LEGE 181152]NEZ65359.1 alpha/beta hydrolase [Adonisia turfae CCMR0082]
MTMIPQQQFESAIGTIEYCDIGTGPPILYFHGTGCGNGVVALFEQSLLDAGYRLITPNRPGYYGTTLGRRGSATFCADLAAHLLDHLNVDRVAVIGTSGGGMPAAQFACRYPDYTAALVLQCAQSHRWDNGMWLPNGLGQLLCLFRHSIFEPLLSWHNRQYWQHVQLNPMSCIESLSGTRFYDIQQDPDVLTIITAMSAMGVDCAAKPAGYLNDLAMMVGDESVALDTIACPTLILHDRADPIVPFAHAEWAYRCISEAYLPNIRLGGHLIWHGAHAWIMREKRNSFLKLSLAV